MSLQKKMLLHKWKRRKWEHNTKTNRTSTSMEYQPVWVPPFDSVDRCSCGCRDAMVSGQNRCAACLLLPLPEFFVFLVLELFPCRLLPEPGWSVDEGFEASNIGCRMRRRALMNQLFTCSNVRFVWAAIWRFSSSVGYGCCNTRCYWSIWILCIHMWLLHPNFNAIWICVRGIIIHAETWYKSASCVTHHQVLEQPGPHDTGSMFRQNTTLLFLFVAEEIIIIIHWSRGCGGWWQLTCNQHQAKTGI